MPGDASFYVAHISAVLYGSLTPDQIEWDLTLAKGHQLEAQYWLARQFSVEVAGVAKPRQRDRMGH